jgi:hypothetical protein
MWLRASQGRPYFPTSDPSNYGENGSTDLIYDGCGDANNIARKK